MVWATSTGATDSQSGLARKKVSDSALPSALMQSEPGPSFPSPSERSSDSKTASRLASESTLNKSSQEQASPFPGYRFKPCVENNGLVIKLEQGMVLPPQILNLIDKITQNKEGKKEDLSERETTLLRTLIDSAPTISADRPIDVAFILRSQAVTVEYFYPNSAEKKLIMSPNTLLKKLQASLQARYEKYSELERLFDGRTVPICESFINLALETRIKRKNQEKVVREKQLDVKPEIIEEKRRAYETSRTINRMSYDDLFNVKGAFELINLFEPKQDTNNHSPDRVLIVGRAGIGKSILCQYLATQWAEQKADKIKSIGHYLQRKFDAVFWFKLREVADFDSANASDFANIVEFFCFKGHKSKRPIIEEWSRYIEEHDDRVLFILDGYDEISDLVHQKGYEHLYKFLDKVDNYKHVLLTTRSIQANTLGNFKFKLSCDRQLENMGFIDKDISAYITQYMRDIKKEGEVVPLTIFLKSQPSLWGIAHIPINLELICWAWSDEPFDITIKKMTLSKLYQTIMYRLKRKHRKKATWGEIELLVINFLEHLAYTAMVKGLQILPGKIIRNSLQLILRDDVSKERQQNIILLAAQNLGFLKSMSVGGKELLDQDHYFIHLSFQEFFAARYIKRNLLDDPNSQLSETVLYFIQLNKYIPRYQLMLWMSAGLLYRAGKKEDSERLGETKKPDNLVNRYHRSSLLRFWRALLAQPRDLVGYHHTVLIMHCLHECEGDHDLLLHMDLMKQQQQFFVAYVRQKYFFYSDSYLDQIRRTPFLWNTIVMERFLLETLSNKDNLINMRTAAAKALGSLGNLSKMAEQALLKILHTEYGKLRAAAVLALSHLKHFKKNVVQSLLIAVKDDLDRESVREAARYALGQVGNSSKDGELILLDMLRDQNDRVQYAGMEALKYLSNPSNIVMQTLLKILLTDKNPIMREEAAMTLRQLNTISDNVVKTLLTALSDADKSTRSRILRTLSEIHHPSDEIVKVLIEEMMDKERNSYLEIYRKTLITSSLVRLRNTPDQVIFFLLDGLKYRLLCIQEEIVKVWSQLNHINDTVVVRLQCMLKNQNEYMRLGAARVLGQFGYASGTVIKSLLDILKNQNGDIQLEAIKVLGRFGHVSDAVVPALFDMLKDKNKNVQITVAVSLVQLGNSSGEVIRIFLDVLKRREYSIRSETVVRALCQLAHAPDDLMIALLNALKDKSYDVQEAAAITLSCLIFRLGARCVQYLIGETFYPGIIKVFLQRNFLVTLNYDKLFIANKENKIFEKISPDKVTVIKKNFPIVMHQISYFFGLYTQSGYVTESKHEGLAILKGNGTRKNLVVTNAVWVVHLIRFKTENVGHAFILIEGVSDRRFSTCYQILLSNTGSRISGTFFKTPPRLKIIKLVNYLKILGNNQINLECQSWDLDTTQGKTLIVQLDKAIKHVRMPLPLSDKLLSPLSWAEIQLKQANLKMNSKCWRNFQTEIPAKALQFGL